MADFENVYEYDKINRPDTIIQRSHGGHAVSPKRADFIYDAASRLQNLNTYAAVTTTAMVNSTTYTVDPSGRLTYLSHFQPGTSNTILYGWGYDRSNRVTSYSRNDTGGLSESQTYNYDDAGQLTGSTGTHNENYTYDANGNRTNTGYSTPAGSDNRLATDGTYSYAYDAEGNLVLRTEVATPGNARVFEYDYRNRLVAVRDYTGYVDALNPGTLVMEAEYTYDVNNLRIKKVVDADGPASAVTTGFVYDQGHVVLQFDGTAGMTNRYLYGPAVDQVLADERASGVLWALADKLGSVRDLVDSGGTPVNHVKYSAFGEKVFELAPATNFLFGYTGAVFDAETNLGYHRARYLDHSTGRWINQDPIQFAAGDANLYRYVGNSSTNATDPSGLAKIEYVPGRVTFFAAQLLVKGQQQGTLTADFDAGWNVNQSAFLDSDDCKLSDEIGIIQIVKTSGSSSIFHPKIWLQLNTDWHIDSDDADIAYDKVSGLYGGAVRGDPTKMKRISMEDGPTQSTTFFGWFGHVTKFRLDFETYVVSLKGKEGIKDKFTPMVGGLLHTRDVTVYAGVAWSAAYTRRSNGKYSAGWDYSVLTAPTNNLKAALTKFYPGGGPSLP